jgi:hypothetical protein
MFGRSFGMAYYGEATEHSVVPAVQASAALAHIQDTVVRGRKGQYYAGSSMRPQK